MILELFESVPAPECRRFLGEISTCEGFTALPVDDRVELIKLMIEEKTGSTTIHIEEDSEFPYHFDCFSDDHSIYVVEPKPEKVGNL